MPEINDIRAALRYDGGTLRWAADGEVADRPHPKGYRTVRVAGKKYLSHRVVWLLMNGDWPESGLDHINRDRADNRIENLRLASASENQCNRGAQANNQSGHPGVFWYARKGKWMAYIKKDNKRTHLGYFVDKADAIKARLAAEVAKFGAFAPQ